MRTLLVIVWYACGRGSRKRSKGVLILSVIEMSIMVAADCMCKLALCAGAVLVNGLARGGSIGPLIL